MKPAVPSAALRHRLMQRILRSQVQESQFITVRRDRGEWTMMQPGVRSKLLAETGAAISLVVDLDAHARLPAKCRAVQVELLLLDGRAGIDELALVPGDAACLALQDTAHALQAGPAGARLYLRLSAPARPASELTHFSALQDDTHWSDFAPGVRIRPLWEGETRRSLLVRMQPGASVGSHGHPLEEECLLLAGEAFVGDTLLRGGDYQLAPQGSEHGAVTTDVGALLYVHGALDPADYA
jgi:quercetin dioxygenase-like cupin family protein